MAATEENEDSDEDLDWYVVKGSRGKPIGALGFLDNEVVVIASFYDDRDANRDGRVSVPEYVVGFLSPLGMKGIAVAAARSSPGRC
jgi:hypothetical protein